MATTSDQLTQVAFSRAINVGGHRVTNDALARVILALGFGVVVPHQASGNLLLSNLLGSVTAHASDTEAAIEQALEAAFGYAVPTMIRSTGQVKAIAEATPFRDEEVSEISGKIQVMFFKKGLDKEKGEAVLTAATPDDRIVVEGSEVYWLPTEGISTSELNVGAINKAVGLLTVRTQGTIVRIAKKLAG